MGKEILNSAKAPTPVGAYNQAVKVGDLLFVSGQIALDADTGQLVMEDIQTETKQVMENLKAILSEAGLSFENVVKCSVFVSDIDNYERINEVYSKYFKVSTAPARELVQVAALPKNVNVEISLIATL